MGYTNKHYILFLLTLTYALNILDRNVLGILIPGIKADMELSDTALGFLSTAFAIFYALFSLPLAYWADKKGRKLVIIISLSLFSLMTALCGMAANFLMLFLTRIGVGIGEAGTMPPSVSLLSEIYSKHRRATVMGILTIGANIGMIAGFVIGGFVAAQYGWRMAFFVIGTPGLALALLMLFTMKKDTPPLARTETSTSIFEDAKKIFRYVGQQRSFIYAALGFGFLLFALNSLVVWLPSFLTRTHGMTLDQIGLVLGLGFGGLGVLGTVIIGGILADYLSRTDPRGNIWVIIGGGVIFIIAFSSALFMPSLLMTLSILAVPGLLGAYFQAPTFSITQSAMPLSIRASSGAIMLVICNLIGIGMGPPIIGLLSDYLQPTYGAESLRYALLLIPIAYCVSIIFYYLASRHLAADIARAEADT